VALAAPVKESPVKTTTAILFAILALLATSAATAQTPEDRKAVERAVLDYVEGVYEVKPELIERSVHPDLKKFGFARRNKNDEYRVIPMTFDQLVKLAGSYNKDGSHVPEGSPKTIELLDVLNQTASAKLTAAWGVDYFHLAKYDGDWKIVHVLWQTLDE
jgi:hypothetical protein